MTKIDSPPTIQTQTDFEHQIEVLVELGKELARSIDIDQTLEMIINRIAAALNAEAASIFLIDSEAEVLRCRAGAGPVDIVGLEIPIEQGIVGRAVATGSVQMIRDVADDPDFHAAVDEGTGFATRSVLCTPLRSSDGVIGAIQVINKCCGSLFSDLDRSTLEILAAPASLAINNARLASELVEQERIHQELQLASRIQQSLFPKNVDCDDPVQGFNLPAREVSGDFFDCWHFPDGRIGFTIGDVAGKGLNASLLMVHTSSLLRWIGKSGTPPGKWLADANAELLETVEHGLFVCALAGIYDPREHRVLLASAGFPPALVHRGDGTFEHYGAGGPPLGIVPMEPLPEHRIDLANSSLWLASDGVTEARLQDGGMLEVEGFEGLIVARPEHTVRGRLSGLRDDLGRFQVSDDSTVLVVDGGRAPRRLLDLNFLSCPTNLQDVRHRLREVLANIDCDAELQLRLVLVVDEGVSNIIRHGYEGDPTRPIRVELHLDGDRLVFRLTDEAPQVDSTCIKPRDLGECHPGGLGINFLDEIMDHWEFLRPADGKGNILVMEKKLEVAS